MVVLVFTSLVYVSLFVEVEDELLVLLVNVSLFIGVFLLGLSSWEVGVLVEEMISVVINLFTFMQKLEVWID